MQKKDFTIPKHIAQHWFDFMWERGAIQKAINEEGIK